MDDKTMDAVELDEIGRVGAEVIHPLCCMSGGQHVFMDANRSVPRCEYYAKRVADALVERGVLVTRTEHEAEKRHANTCFRHRDTALMVRIVENPPMDGAGLVFCPKCERQADAERAAACAEMREQAAQHYPTSKGCYCGLSWREDESHFEKWQAHIRSLPVLHADALARAKASVAAFKAEAVRVAQNSDPGDHEMMVKPIVMCSTIAARLNALPADDSALARLIAKARLDALEEVDRRATKRRLLYAVALAEYHLELMQAHPELTGRAALTAEAEGKSLT